jgi:hypothetical protein
MTYAVIVFVPTLPVGLQYVTFHAFVPDGPDAFIEICEVELSDPPPPIAVPVAHVAVTEAAVPTAVGPAPVAVTVVNVFGDPCEPWEPWAPWSPCGPCEPVP